MTLQEDIKRIQELLKVADGAFNPQDDKWKERDIHNATMPNTLEYLVLCANTAPILIARLQKAEELLRTAKTVIETPQELVFDVNLWNKIKQFLAESDSK
jgi:hypothetical protein